MSTLERDNKHRLKQSPLESSNIAKDLIPPSPWWTRSLHRWIARLIFIAALPYEVFLLLLAPAKTKPTTRVAHLIPSGVQSGNLIFGKTNSIRGKWLQAYLKTTTYTHVGVIKQNENQWSIVHASPGNLSDLFRDGGVREDGWEEFVAKSQISEYAFYRLREGSKTSLLEAAEAIAQRRMPFDIHYDLHDHKRLYCSDFIWHLGLQLGQDWVESRFHDIRFLGLDSPGISPDAIAMSQNLERIPTAATRGSTQEAHT